MAKRTGFESIGSRAGYRVKVKDLTIREGWNAREEYGDLDELARSIAAIGVKKALKGYFDSETGKCVITDGHRRLKAIQIANEQLGASVHSVMLFPEDRYANDGDRLLTQLISNSGKPLTPLEQSRVMRRLLDYGWTEDEIVKKTGKTIVTVRNCLELSAVSPQLKTMVANGDVAASTVVKTIREVGKKEAEESIPQAVQLAKSAGKKKATQTDVQAVVSQKQEETPTDEQTSLIEPKRSPRVTVQQYTAAEISEARDRITKTSWDNVEAPELMKIKKILDLAQVPTNV